jgi:hypothetical protein
VVLVVVVDSKHNRSKVSFQVMENEIVRGETTRWKTPTPKLIVRKAPILGSKAKERGRKYLQNCVSTRSSDQVTVFDSKAVFVSVTGCHRECHRLIYWRNIYKKLVLVSNIL